jgi:hypothetical protein
MGKEMLANYRAMDGAAKQVAQAYMNLFANSLAEIAPTKESF